jgi:hypothetical protein
MFVNRSKTENRVINNVFIKNANSNIERINMSRMVGLFLSGALMFLITACGSGSTSEKQDSNTVAEHAAVATTYVTMPENTSIAVTLVDSIDTDVHLTGAEFRARLARPIVVDGHTLFADGAAAKGILNKVVESGRLKTPAELSFSLISIQSENGKWIDVGTKAIQEKKSSHTKREVAMIGGGAIVGGIVGKIIDRKGSTEIGAVAGAAAGTGLSAATGKQDILHRAGTEVVFYSNQSTQIALK